MMTSNSERIFTRNFTLDMVVSFCCSLNYFVLLINIVGFSTSQLGVTSAEAGLAAGLYVIGGLISRLLFGKYIEIVGRKKMLVIFIALTLLMSFAYFGVTNIILLYIIRFAHGTLYGMASTCTSDIAAKLIPPSRRGEGLGYFYLSVTLSMAIGPFIGLELGRLGDYNLVFSVGVVMYTIALAASLLLHVKDETYTEEQRAVASKFTLKGLIHVPAIPYGIVAMIFYFSYSGVLSFIATYSEEVDLIEASTFFYLAVSLGTLISRFTTGKIYDARGPNIIIIPGYIAFFLAMLAFSMASEAALFLVSGFFMGFGISIIYAICQAIVVDKSTPKEYGVATSTYASLTDLGTGLGPMFLGLLLPITGFRCLYMICAFISLLSLVVYWIIHGHNAFRKTHMCNQ